MLLKNRCIYKIYKCNLENHHLKIDDDFFSSQLHRILLLAFVYNYYFVYFTQVNTTNGSRGDQTDHQPVDIAEAIVWLVQ